MDKVTDPSKIVTDELVLKELARQGIDKDYVEFHEDYNIQHKYAKVYRDLKSNKRVQAISTLPHVNHAGEKIIAGWERAGEYWHVKTNTFVGAVHGTEVQIACVNDQPDGRKQGNAVLWNPQLFIGGKEVKPNSVEASLLSIDPLNPDLTDCTLEWDYGVCTRNLRLIKGRIKEYWYFESKPTGDIRIVHNSMGDWGLKLGTCGSGTKVFKANIIDNDIEEVPLDIIPQYPLIIQASSTFYPDADVESTSVDGYAYESTDDTWSVMRAAGGDSSYDDYYLLVLTIDASATTNEYIDFGRLITLFDTSGLDDEATISAGTYSLYYYTKTNEFAETPSFAVVSSNPASNTTIAAGDFDSLGTTRYATDLGYGDIGAGYNDWTLNSTGLAAIPKDGITKFGLRVDWDLDDSEPTWGNRDTLQMGWYSADNGSNEPKLVVTYTVGEIPHNTGRFAAMMAG